MGAGVGVATLYRRFPTRESLLVEPGGFPWHSGRMIQGVHLLLYSRDPVADRAFLRDVLGWPAVADPGSGEGWLIFETPPSELGVHPTDGAPAVQVHLMCDDIEATVAELTAKGVPTGPVADAGYGLATTLTLPSGAEVGLYEPRHESPLARFKR